ncbi:translocation/assembly module TamB domain-containing protein [Olleya sp. YS]|uniref:translocation/assembly module TamB domain-containing protein n=1 Tax=Olleya sp. YS TaxID=3028318 RepID=UPI00243467CF|nr:translocation/assembly module TamB domain-containing protein [Olleya sp. YS]WGD34461.1 translocation/assembly module TamB domain-containing protein [Olleya sp. YS]
MLFIILVLVLSIPAVQTSLGKYATKRLNEEFKTNINIEKVGLQFNGDVELKGVLIKDFKKDTLISASELNTSIISFKNLYDGKLNLGDINLDDLVFNVVKYQGETDTNLDVFVARFNDDNPRKDKSEFLLSSSDVTINNGTFRLIDENKQTPQILRFDKINLNGTNFVIDGSDVTSRINTLQFVDSRGLKLENLTSDFSYTLTQMRFDNLSLKTPESFIKGNLVFDYTREDFKAFEDKVKVSANFNEGSVLLDELNVFYNEFGVNQRANFSTKISGTLNDLTTRDLDLQTNRNTTIKGTINFKNLFNSEENNFAMVGDFRNLSSNYKDLKALLPNVLGESIPSIFDKLGSFSASGTSNITPNKIKADLEINTKLGYIDSNLEMSNIDNIDFASYKGNLILDEFNLGLMLDDPKLGVASLNVDVDGVGFKKENLSTQLKGDIYNIKYNNYNYQNIVVNGQYKQSKFNGKLVSNDKNLKLEFNGLADLSKDISTFDFVANVNYANLKALNFYKRDEQSEFTGIVDMKMKATNIDDAVGSINFKNTVYKNENDTYIFKDFAISSEFSKNERFIKINSPDIIEGQLNGNFKFNDLDVLFENSLKSIYANYVPNQIIGNQYIDFNFKIYNKIVEVFLPEVEVGANTFIKGRVESNEKAFKLTFKSPKIKLLDYFAETIEVQVDNNNPLFNTYVEVDSVFTKHYSVSKFNLINVTLNDTLFMRSEFKGGKRNDDNYNLSFYHTINKDNLSVVGFKKSDVTFKNNKWFVNEDKNKFNKIIFDRDFKNFKIEELVMNHENEEIKLAGTIRDSTYKDLKLNFKDVDLNKIIPDVEKLTIAGNINGKLDILQQNGNYLPNSSITIDNLEVNETFLGSFDAKITGNATLSNYIVDAKIKDDNTNSFTAKGNINTNNGDAIIDVNLAFNKFSLQILNPFLEGVLSDIRGDVYGTAKVLGNLNKPSFNGQLNIDNGGLGVPYLSVDYAFQDNASVSLKNQSFIFNTINITDTKENSKGLLDGSISHTNFSKWKLDLNLETPRLLVLDTQETEESLYYGTGFIGGSASIYGPSENLSINVIGETKTGTVFKIPLNDNESFGDNSIIHFLSPEEKQAKQEGVEIETEVNSGLDLNFELDVTEDAEIEILIDKTSGSTIKGRGVGGLLIEINTNNKFDMYGDFVVYEGVYNFLYGGVIQKQFIVEPYVSNLAWNGPPLDAIIDIKAKYVTRANPSPLLDNSINRSIPVELTLELSDRLERPEINYEFNFPNTSSTIRSEIDYRLDSKEEKESQALFLIATGAFSSGLNNINFTGTLTERLNGLVNNLLSSGDGKFNIGVNFEAGQNRPDFQTDNRVGLTLQTKISDRVLINGKLGVPVGGLGDSVIAGDVQVDFLLNEEGTLTAKVFNRENSIRNFGEEIGYTQGVGLSYSVSFDTFGELLRKIFSPKKEQENQELQEDNNPDTSTENNSPFPEDMTFKKE